MPLDTDDAYAEPFQTPNQGPADAAEPDDADGFAPESPALGLAHFSRSHALFHFRKIDPNDGRDEGSRLFLQLMCIRTELRRAPGPAILNRPAISAARRRKSGRGWKKIGLN
jgi:hypothetical protein